MANFSLSASLIVALCTAFLVNEINSLECYKCVSSIGDSCGSADSVNTTNLEKVTCSENEVCGKHQELEPGLGSSKIRRDCVESNYCEVNVNATIIRQCTVCSNRSLCNSASSTIPSIILMGILSFVLFKTIV